MKKILLAFRKKLGDTLILLMIVIATVTITHYFENPSPSEALYMLEKYNEVEIKDDTMFIFREHQKQTDFYFYVSALEPHYVLYVIDLTWEQ